MVLALLEPARATFQLLRAEPLPSSPQPPRQGNNDAFQKLGIHLPEETELRLAVLCSPSAGESGATKTVEIRKLEQW